MRQAHYSTAMFHLSILLCIASNAQSESLISIRDHEFVGEDKRLMSKLSERMAVVRDEDVAAWLNDNSTDDKRHPYATDEDLHYNASLADLGIQLEPDLLELKSKIFPRVNVSLDYGELIKVSGNVSLGSSAAWQPAVDLTASANGSRRVYWDHEYPTINKKIKELMKQNIYSVQNRLLDIQPIVQKYETDERFRMAYIFSRIKEWKRDIRTIHFAMERWRVEEGLDRFRFVDQLLHYEHLLRKSIDITYSIEFLIYLHSEYVSRMKVPPR